MISKSAIPSLVLLALLSFASSSYAQLNYESTNNGRADWNDNIWAKNQNWGNDNPGRNLGGATTNVVVKDYVYVNDNLTIGGNSALQVIDTLVVMGNLHGTGGGMVSIENGGVLVVLGDFISDGGFRLTNNEIGKIVVAGEIVSTGGAGLTVNERFYMFDETPQFSDGANINGIGATWDNNMSYVEEFGTPDELVENDLPLALWLMHEFDFFSMALPVSIVEFNAKAAFHSVQLNWKVSSEINVEAYLIERSIDGKLYNEIGEVAALNYADGILNYSFEDQCAANGLQYYRLKVKDFDGAVRYSNVVSAQYNGLPCSKFSIYPNPVNNGFVNVRTNGEANNASVNIFNMAGQVVFTQKGLVGEQRIELPYNIQSGLYIVEIAESGQSFKERILIQ